MKMASETGGVIVCSNPYAMTEKAKAYGFTNLEFVSYSEFGHSTFHYKKYYIDDLEAFINHCFLERVYGYTLSIENWSNL